MTVAGRSDVRGQRQQQRRDQEASARRSAARTSRLRKSAEDDPSPCASTPGSPDTVNRTHTERPLYGATRNAARPRPPGPRVHSPVVHTPPAPQCGVDTRGDGPGRLADPSAGQQSLTSLVGQRCPDAGDVRAWRRIDDLERARGVVGRVG